MKTQTRISGTMTVNEAIRRAPATLAVFKRHGIDSCCGGALPIATAAERHGARADALLEALNSVSEEA
ncbi:MAG TPA: DUF542 domain-containing protein [Longimicrobium sp.]|nr:DUF542 domain-containing protein [Longimicrobium sp.]